MNLRQKLLVIPVMFFAGLAVLQLVNLYEQNQVRKIMLSEFKAEILNGHKSLLKATTDVEATSLAAKLKNSKTKEEQTAIVITETDPIRFFEDRSGYFFTYDTNGVRINVPINKSQNGQNLINLVDKKNFRFVEEFVKIAKNGGGFVQYYFEKEGKGVQPKLSYAAMIPGTDILIGTGVYIDNVETEALALESKLETTQNSHSKGLAVIFIVIVGIGVWVVWMMGRSITKSIQTVSDHMLSVSEQVSEAAAQVSSTSQSLAEGASEQASSLEETSSSLEEMSSMTKGSAKSAQEVNELGKRARGAAEKGETDMKAMIAAMDAIAASSSEVGKIIKTIDEIAFQTNILALNAAVEAARAGESGMGFAVVAEEVRNLAQRSAQAARETSEKIEGAIAKTTQGVNLSGVVAEGLKEIVDNARKVDTLTEGVASAAREQSQGIDQVNIAVSQIDKVTQNAAASAEESASAAAELDAQAQALKSAVYQLSALIGGSDHAHQKSTKIVSSYVEKTAPKHSEKIGVKKLETKQLGAESKPKSVNDDDFK